MSAKQPVIKFSPFQALLIGEKNKVLKRQPLKNTIFVTRLNQQSKTFNLRDLFGLEKDTERSESNDVIFKMPQRVCDFLKSRKLKSKSSDTVGNVEEEILCYEFEGQQLIFNKNGIVKPKVRKLKSEKWKFDRRCNCREAFEEEVINKLFRHSRRKNVKKGKSENIRPRLVLKEVKQERYNVNRHSLRGKDGKFICKTEYENVNSKEISSQQKYISKCVHQFHLKKSKIFYSKDKRTKNDKLNKLNMPLSLENIFKIINLQNQFGKTVPEKILNKALRNFVESNFLEGFQFSKLPNEIQASDYEDDGYLIDLIYEDFPQTLKFGSSFFSDDFADALRNIEIVTHEKGLKIYEKKRNGFVKNQEVRVIFDGYLPYQFHELKTVDNVKSIHNPLTSIRNDFASMIDEPYTKKSHLITGKSFASLFFRSAEGKDIFVGNLVKPFMHNSWFGSLSEF